MPESGERKRNLTTLVLVKNAAVKRSRSRQKVSESSQNPLSSSRRRERARQGRSKSEVLCIVDENCQLGDPSIWIVNPGRERIQSGTRELYGCIVRGRLWARTAGTSVFDCPRGTSAGEDFSDVVRNCVDVPR